MISASSGTHNHVSHADSPATIPEEPSSTDTQNGPDKSSDDNSKLRMLLGILRKLYHQRGVRIRPQSAKLNSGCTLTLYFTNRFVGVADIATVRFSLPAQLLEPTPNLEYWNYLDQPSAFIAIGNSDDPLDRMLEVLRFWFTKDLKYVKGKPCKPYNSTLGEFFRCNWEIEDSAPEISVIKNVAGGSSASSFRSRRSRNSSVNTIARSSSVTGAPIKKFKVSYLTEQTSHHPPVSAFFVDCPEKGLIARGYDQITAKFTGMSIRVSPGENNHGIFITLKKWDDEEYHLTHPIAHIGGILRGSLSVTVGEQCYITCAKTKIKTILHYVEESWLGKSHNKVEGVIFKYNPEQDDIKKVKDVPESDILARLSGAWKETVYFSIGSKGKTKIPLIELAPLNLAEKIVPPLTDQLDNESRLQWSGVTDAINSRQYSKATTLKLELEEQQRSKVKARENQEKLWKPRFFVSAISPDGKPELTPEGEKVLAGLQRGEWKLNEKDDES